MSKSVIDNETRWRLPRHAFPLCYDACNNRLHLLIQNDITVSHE